MSYTPGPWQASWEVDEWFVSDHGKQWSCVATVSANELGRRRVEDDEAEANARLIAAAPELLEACRLALRHHDKAEVNDLRECLIAVIAKATEPLPPGHVWAKGQHRIL